MEDKSQDATIMNFGVISVGKIFVSTTSQDGTVLNMQQIIVIIVSQILPPVRNFFSTNMEAVEKGKKQEKGEKQEKGKKEKSAENLRKEDNLFNLQNRNYILPICLAKILCLGGSD